MSDNPWDELSGREQESVDDSFVATVQVGPWFCVLQKGIGKVPFDPAAHHIKDRQVAITIIATTERGNDIIREFLSWDAGWKQFQRSIEALGRSPQYFEEPRRVRIRFADIIDRHGNPITYTSRDGQVRNRTTIEVTALLDGEHTNGVQPDETASPSSDIAGPRDPAEGVAYEWLREAAGRAVPGATPDDLIKALGAMVRKPSMRAITRERWMELARKVLEDSRHIPF